LCCWVFPADWSALVFNLAAIIGITDWRVANSAFAEYCKWRETQLALPEFAVCRGFPAHELSDHHFALAVKGLTTKLQDFMYF